MVAASTTPRPATGPPSAFNSIVERYGTVALLRMLGALLAFTALHLVVRLPLLLALRMCEALMARVEAPVAAGFPGRSPHAAYEGGPA